MKMKSNHTLKLSTRINRATGKNTGYLQNAAFIGSCFKLCMFKCCYVNPTANLHNRGKVENTVNVYKNFDSIVLVPWHLFKLSLLVIPIYF